MRKMENDILALLLLNTMMEIKGLVAAELEVDQEPYTLGSIKYIQPQPVLKSFLIVEAHGVVQDVAFALKSLLQATLLRVQVQLIVKL